MSSIRRSSPLFRRASMLSLLAVLAACGSDADPVSPDVSASARSAADTTGTAPGDSATWERRIILY